MNAQKPSFVTPRTLAAIQVTLIAPRGTLTAIQKILAAIQVILAAIQEIPIVIQVLNAILVTLTGGVGTVNIGGILDRAALLLARLGAANIALLHVPQAQIHASGDAQPGDHVDLAASVHQGLAEVVDHLTTAVPVVVQGQDTLPADRLNLQADRPNLQADRRSPQVIPCIHLVNPVPRPQALIHLVCRTPAVHTTQITALRLVPPQSLT